LKKEPPSLKEAKNIEESIPFGSWSLQTVYPNAEGKES